MVRPCVFDSGCISYEAANCGLAMVSPSKKRKERLRRTAVRKSVQATCGLRMACQFWPTLQQSAENIEEWNPEAPEFKPAIDCNQHVWECLLSALTEHDLKTASAAEDYEMSTRRSLRDTCCAESLPMIDALSLCDCSVTGVPEENIESKAPMLKSALPGSCAPCMGCGRGRTSLGKGSGVKRWLQTSELKEVCNKDYGSNDKEEELTLKQNDYPRYKRVWQKNPNEDPVDTHVEKESGGRVKKKVGNESVRKGSGTHSLSDDCSMDVTVDTITAKLGHWGSQEYIIGAVVECPAGKVASYKHIFVGHGNCVRCKRHVSGENWPWYVCECCGCNGYCRACVEKYGYLCEVGVT